MYTWFVVIVCIGALIPPALALNAWARKGELN